MNVIPLLGVFIETRDTTLKPFTEEKIAKARHFAHKKKFDDFTVLFESQVALQKMLDISEYDSQVSEIIAEVLSSQAAFGQTIETENNLLNAVVNAMGIDFTKRVERKQTSQNVFRRANKLKPK